MRSRFLLCAAMVALALTFGCKREASQPPVVDLPPVDVDQGEQVSPDDVGMKDDAAAKAAEEEAAKAAEEAAAKAAEEAAAKAAEEEAAKKAAEEAA
ncbi:MAG: hypothetical protein FJ276_25950, partial [Planctomycetes bacterium]|nr:hypothetical protein [Planctomycetota bacterium]